MALLPAKAGGTNRRVRGIALSEARRSKKASARLTPGRSLSVLTRPVSFGALPPELVA